MMKFLTLLFCLSFYHTYLFAQDRTTVAVSKFELVNFSPSESWLSAYFTESITSGLSTYEKIILVERENIKKITDEFYLQLSGIIDENSTVEVGKILGAQKLIVGKILHTDHGLRLSCQIIYIESGTVLHSFLQDNKSEQIVEMERETLNKLLNYFIDPQIKLISDKDILDKNSLRILFEAQDIIKSFPIIGLYPSRRRYSTEYLLWVDRVYNISMNHKASVSLYLALANILLQLEKYDQALANIEKAKKLNPDNPEIDYITGNLYYAKKNYSQAKHHLNQYLLKTPNCSKGWHALGKIHLEINEEVEAALSYLKSIINDHYIPNSEEVLKTLLLSNKQASIITYISSQSPELGFLAKLYVNYWSKNMVELEKTLPFLTSLSKHLYIIVARKFKFPN